jgi:hypothetical protein
MSGFEFGYLSPANQTTDPYPYAFQIDINHRSEEQCHDLRDEKASDHGYAQCSP